jgi:hypothetical protein
LGVRRAYHFSAVAGIFGKQSKVAMQTSHHVPAMRAKSEAQRVKVHAEQGHET